MWIFLINNINLMIYYNHIEIFLKEVCDASTHFVEDCVLFWITTITTCAVVMEAHCTKFVWVGLIMTDDNIRQCLKTISNDDNIHSSLYMAREKVGNLFVYMSSTFWCDGCNGILKCIMGCSAFTPTWAM